MDCGCEPSGEKYCQVNSIECDADADCPSGWTCEAGGETCWGDENGVVGCETLPSNCYPPGRGDGVGGSDPGAVPGEETSSGGEDDGTDDSDESSDDEEPTDDDGETTEDHNGRPLLDLRSLLGCGVQHAPREASVGALAWLVAALGAVVVRRRRAR